MVYRRLVGARIATALFGSPPPASLGVSRLLSVVHCGTRSGLYLKCAETPGRRAVGIDVDVFVHHTPMTRNVTRFESLTSVKEKAVVGSPMHAVIPFAKVRLPTKADFGHAYMRAERGARIGGLRATTYTAHGGKLVSETRSVLHPTPVDVQISSEAGVENLMPTESAHVDSCEAGRV